MVEQFFNIKFQFDKNSVLKEISEHVKSDSKSDYVCVVDGVIMNNVHTSQDYCEVINGGMFSICDSSYIPLYIRAIYGVKRSQYCGSMIFKDIIALKQYNMCFLGTNTKILNGLRENLQQIDSRITNMLFYELPFCDVDDFDYEAIARMVEAENADIIWVALGAPKQEIFMSKLKPHLKRGVMIAVGAAFKFYSGVDVKRAPSWMVRNRLEFVHRIMMEPKKQIKRCLDIVRYLPAMLGREYKRKNII
ncbi:MAG: WecB/TagA/CpsF family glycosyltransferase [Rikenellaceae bacterium]